jgi:hypothetical protein
MKPKVLPILEQCIETGICLGYNRARKYDVVENEQQLFNLIQQEIMNNIHEYFYIETYVDNISL